MKNRILNFIFQFCIVIVYLLKVLPYLRDRSFITSRGGGGGAVFFEGGEVIFLKRALFWGGFFYLVRKVRGVKSTRYFSISLLFFRATKNLHVIC